MTGATESFDAITAGTEQASYVVTAAADGRHAGCLVAFATQCSIDPPRFGVWLSNLNRTFRVARSATTLVVHLLRQDDADLAERFGGDTGDDVDKFAGIAWHPGPDGCPVIERLDWFAGSVVDHYDSGDHVGFLLLPSGGECRRPDVAQLPQSVVAEIDAGHPIPGR